MSVPQQVYVGQWEDGKRQGRGAQTYVAKEILQLPGNEPEGEIPGSPSALPNSPGSRLRKLPSGNKDCYNGEWLNDKPHGEGTLDMKGSTGDTYEGQFAVGMPSGQGKCFYASGAVYTGQWRVGKRDGHGVFRSPAGTVYDGQWVNDQRSGSAIITEMGQRRSATFARNRELRSDEEV